MGSRIVLQGEYDVWRREELRALLERADLSGDVTLDMRQTVLIDAGAAALLIALQHRLHERNPRARVVLLDAPRIVRRVLELCNAADLFVFSAQR